MKKLCVHNNQIYFCPDDNCMSLCKTQLCKTHKKQRCRSCAVDLHSSKVKNWLYSIRTRDKLTKEAFQAIKDPIKQKLDELLKEQKTCFYCGIDLQFKDHKGANMASLERLNNQKGHIPCNLTLCCIQCNRKHNKGSFYIKGLIN